MYKLPGIIILFLTATIGGYYLWQFSADATATFTADRPSFQADLKNTLDLQEGVGVPTFTRATIATVTDMEGLIKTVKSNEARFENSRRVENLIPTPSNSLTSGNNKTVTVTAGTYVFSMGAGASSGVATFSGTGGATGTITQNATKRTSQSFTLTAGTFIITASVATLIDLQFEQTTGQAISTIPSEYISVGVLTSAPYHGANVDGVKYFTTYNGNTTASNVVTEATGASIPDATLHGYVAEGARTNLLTYSEQFDNASWTMKQGGSINPDSITAPSGAVTADKFVEDTSNNNHGILRNPFSASSVSYTDSIYAKAGENNYIYLWMDNGSGHGHTLEVNLSDGTSRFTRQDNTNYSNTSSFVTALGNGWYRVGITSTPITYSSIQIRFYMSHNAWVNESFGTPTYTGDGTSGIYVWGAQLEAGSFASSYIPTTTASVTRNSDALWYPSVGNVDSTKGTVYATYNRAVNSNYYSTLVHLGNVAGTEYATLFVTTVTNVLRFGVGTGGVAQTDMIGGSAVGTGEYRMAGTWSLNNFGKFLNGTKNGTDTSGDVPTSFATIDIGDRRSNSIPAFAAIKNIKIWKKALTDTQLTNLTSTNASVSQSAVKKTIVNASQNTKLTSGLVGLWSFNGTDISGTTAYDRSGQGNNGTLTGGVTKTIGKVGQALSFDGTSGYVSLGTSYNGVKSVSFWIKPNTTTQSILDLNGTDKITVSGGTIAVAGFNGASTVYVNGAVSSTLTTDWNHVIITTATGLNANAFTLGLSGGVYFAGKIDEVRIYNRALSANEVRQLYNMGR